MPADLYTEVRSRYPEYADWSEPDLYQNLVQPDKFRQAFPEYQDWSDADLLRNTQKFAPKGFAEQHPILEAIAEPLEFLSRPFAWQPIESAKEIGRAFKEAYTGPPPTTRTEALTETIPRQLTQVVRGAGGIVFPPLLAAGVVAAPQITVPVIAGMELARRGIKRGIEEVTPSPPLTPALTELASEVPPLVAAPLVGKAVGRSVAQRQSGWEAFYRREGMEPKRAAEAAELSAAKGLEPPEIAQMPTAPERPPVALRPPTPTTLEHTPPTPTAPTPRPIEQMPAAPAPLISKPIPSPLVSPLPPGTPVADRAVLTKLMREISSDVPRETLIQLGERPENIRIFQRLADTIEQAPAMLPKVPEILQKYNLTPSEFALWFRYTSSKGGRDLATLSRIAKQVNKVVSKEAQAILKPLVGEEASPWSWQGILDKYRVVDHVRRAAMISQMKTAARNAISQAGNYSVGIIEDAVQGLINVGHGMKVDAAFAKATEDVWGIGRILKKSERRAMDTLLGEFPIEQARLLNSPIADLSLTDKASRVLTTFSRAVELPQRRLVFDASVRGQLREKGYDVSGMPGRWQVPQRALEQAVENAVGDALRITWAETPRQGPARFVLDMYNRFPFLTLIQPFPRFFFGNALKWAYQYSPAALFAPKTWAALRQGNSRAATRATIGTMMSLWAMTYRLQDDAPQTWYKVRVKGTDYDTRPFAPFATWLFIGESIADAVRLQRGEPMRITERDMTLALLGMNRIAGSGLAIVDAILESREPLAALKKGREVAGQIAASFLVPLGMLRDLLGETTDEERIWRDVRGEPFLGSIQRAIPVLSRGLPATPAVTRPGPFISEGLGGSTAATQLTGLTGRTPTSVETELDRAGIKFYELMPPSSGEPEVDRRAAEIVGEDLDRILTRLFAKPQYQNLDKAARKDIILRATASLRNLAAKKALAEAGKRRTGRVERLRGAPRSVPATTPITPPRQ